MYILVFVFVSVYACVTKGITISIITDVRICLSMRMLVGVGIGFRVSAIISMRFSKSIGVSSRLRFRCNF